MTLTVKTEDLTTAIKRVLPHLATPAQNLPVLEDIRFTLHGDHLVLTGCDRYTIGEVRIAVEVNDGDAATAFYANGKRLKEILPALKADAGTAIQVTDSGVASFGGLDVPHADGDYPAVDRLWPDEFTPLAEAVTGILPEHLKKLTAVSPTRQEKADQTCWRFGQQSSAAGKPLLALFGQGMRVLLMPVSKGAEHFPETGRADYESWS